MSQRLSRSLLATVLAALAAAGFTHADLGDALAAAREVEAVVRVLADDAFGGRDNLSAGSLSAQEYLIGQLAAVGEGFDPLRPGVEAYRQPFAEGTNLLAVIPGRELPDEYVVVGAHYDHFGSGGCFFDSGARTNVCNGATDNAAGVAIVLAIGRALRALPTPPRRSVVLALWDAEEDGLLGSEYFADQQTVPLERIAGYVNFDIQGANLLPSLQNRSFALGAETGGPGFQQLVADAVAAQSLRTLQLSVVFGQNRSDHASFYLRGVPSVFFTDANGGCYHTTGDEIEVVDFGKLAEQSQIGFRTVLALAEGDERPETPPTQPPLVTYDDVAGIADLLTTALVDLDLFPPFYRSRILTIEAAFRRRADAGPEAFDIAETFTILFEAADVVDILTTTRCDGYLDGDEDGVLDSRDNCPAAPNGPLAGADDQLDTDGDGIGDACECGDFNRDGRVDTTDARLIQRCVVGQIPCAGLCDTNGDGRCTTVDARLVQRFAVRRLGKHDLVCAERPRS